MSGFAWDPDGYLALMSAEIADYGLDARVAWSHRDLAVLVARASA